MKKVHLSMINLWCNKNLVDSQLFLWKLLSENPDKVEYYTEPYDSHVEIVLLNTCGFISSWREEMFQNIEKLLKAKKKICLIGCGVQYFEKVLKKNIKSVISNGCEKSSRRNWKMLYEKWQIVSILEMLKQVQHDVLRYA